MRYGIHEIDHVVAAVADPERAGELLAGIGFRVTPLSVMNRGGVANRLVLLRPQTAGTANFFELMGIVDKQAVSPPLLLQLQGERGYRWIVLSGPDAIRTHKQLTREGYPFGEPMAIQRDWTLPSGEVLHVAFTVLLPIDAPVPFNFCAYETPQHYVREEFLDHPNGAQSLTQVLCEAESPEECLVYFERLFGVTRRRHAADLFSITPGKVELVVGTATAWRHTLDLDASQVSMGPRVFGCRIRVADLAATASYLDGVGVAHTGSCLGLVVRSPLADETCFVFHA